MGFGNATALLKIIAQISRNECNFLRNLVQIQRGFLFSGTQILLPCFFEMSDVQVKVTHLTELLNVALKV